MTTPAEIVPWIPATKRTALVKESEAWIEIAKQALTFAVVDDATAAHAAKLVKQSREILRAKEEERKTITVPLNQAVKATNDYFRPTTDALERIKRHYEQQIAAYDLKREQARAAVLVQSAAELSVGIVPTEPIPSPVHVANTSIRHHWEPEIVDAELVPREYCSPDVSKIKDAIWYADTPHKEPQPIPGVKFNLKSITVVR